MIGQDLGPLPSKPESLIWLSEIARNHEFAVLGDVNGHDYTIVDGSTNVDLSVSYNVTPNLRVSIEGQNLTDTPLRYGRDSQRNDTLLYVHSGRSFVLGANYKF
jgi:outer membrane receptor protein involved in Fe transport